MKRTKTPILLFLVVVATVLIVRDCRRDAQHEVRPTEKFSGTALGTTFNITIVGDVPDEFEERLTELLTESNSSMSIFDKNSLLSRINRGETDSVDHHIAHCVALAERVSEVSEGAYDITIGPLVEALGFAGKDADYEANIDSLLEFVGYEKIALKEGRIVKQDPRVMVDLNSIAKGYTVDLVAGLIEEYGHRDYLVDIGGEIFCRGTNPRGEAWSIGVETPFEGNYSTSGEYITTIIRISEVGMATSGNYRNFHTDAEGNKYTHIIDPLTGENTSSSLLSATVVAESCALADAYGTMFMALGLERSREVAAQEGIAALFIYDDAGKMTTETTPTWKW